MNPTPKIAAFFHCIVSGGSIPIDTNFACSIVKEQLDAHQQSGLLEASDEFVIGINGGEEDGQIVKLFVPWSGIQFVCHGEGATTEIPTLELMRQWLPGHEDWIVFYSHAKGVTHAGEALYSHWRKCMTRHVIWGWKDCVRHLQNGIDACGCHWLTPNKFPGIVKSPFFGGTFWAAKASYLATLPVLPTALWVNRFEAESWIGRGKNTPRVWDFHPQWPGMTCK